MTEQQTTGWRLPEWALMYVIHDAFRRDLQALEAALDGHLSHEEADALPLISRVMTEAGVASIFRAFGKLGGLKRGATLLPWALSGAGPTSGPRCCAACRPQPGCSTGPSGCLATAAPPRRCDHRSGYRLGSDRGSPNHGSTLLSKRVMAQIRSPVRVRTYRPVPWRMPVGARR